MFRICSFIFGMQYPTIDPAVLVFYQMEAMEAGFPMTVENRKIK